MLRSLKYIGILFGPILSFIVLAAGSPEMHIPEDNPMTPEKVELGRKLFYDVRLSSDDTVSCASCHLQSAAFADPRPVSVGVEGRSGTRNAPSLANVGYRKGLFWEGRSPKLELQAVAPLTDHFEMNMTPDALVEKLSTLPEYEGEFEAVFGEALTMKSVTYALSAFQRSILSQNSPYDQWRAGNREVLDEAQVRGMELFFGETGDCFHCHVGSDFTDELPHNNANQADYEDIGLARVTGKESDIGRFKTPSLRNVALTAPYMHDGSMTSLREVIENYNDGGHDHPNADTLMRPLGLSDEDIDDLIAFLESLTDETLLTDESLSTPFQAD